MHNEFVSFPKIPRLNRTVIVTEKIDGTNAGVLIPFDPGMPVHAQSRTRFITPENDNYGFATWVRDHESELRGLGPGLHFGEWWGRGIQRNYGQTERHFSLFNVSRWNKTLWLHYEAIRAARESMRLHTAVQMSPWVPPPACCLVVPAMDVLDTFDSSDIWKCMRNLEENGSVAAPGWMKPEGVVVFHVAGGHLFKLTFDDNHKLIN